MHHSTYKSHNNNQTSYTYGTSDKLLGLKLLPSYLVKILKYNCIHFRVLLHIFTGRLHISLSTVNLILINVPTL